MIKQFLLPIVIVIGGVGLAAAIIATGPTLEQLPPPSNAPLVRTWEASSQTVRMSSITHGGVACFRRSIRDRRDPAGCAIWLPYIARPGEAVQQIEGKGPGTRSNGRFAGEIAVDGFYFEPQQTDLTSGGKEKCGLYLALTRLKQIPAVT
jgi:hypothetical protein